MAERILLALLMAASAYGFWWRFRPVWRNIRIAKPDADFHLRPIGRRVADFVWEVMLQGKVIRQRPLPGLAHALVFWGFCAFALVTVNHFAAGFGLGFLDRAGLFGRTTRTGRSFVVHRHNGASPVTRRISLS